MQIFERMASTLRMEHWFAIATRGRKVGIVIFKNEGLDIEILKGSNQLIHCCVKGDNRVAKWFITSVYGSPYYWNKHELWDYLYEL